MSRSSGARLLLIVCILCAPCIVATAAVWAKVWVAAGDVSIAPNDITNLLESTLPWLFVTAAYSPALVVVAVPFAIRLARTRGVTSHTVTAWAALFLALASTAVFYRVLMWKVPLP
jgi:hypothetical protein